MSVQAPSTERRNSRIRAERWSGCVGEGIYQSTEFGGKCLPKTGLRRKEYCLTLRRLTYILVGMLASSKTPQRRAIRFRDAGRTRERLLQAASREIYRAGFQSASLDTILDSAGVTKGALYHHFDS